MYEYSVEAIINSGGETTIGEWIQSQDGQVIDQRSHKANHDQLDGTRVIHRCLVPSTVSSLDHVVLDHTGIEANGKMYDLEYLAV